MVLLQTMFLLQRFHWNQSLHILFSIISNKSLAQIFLQVQLIYYKYYNILPNTDVTCLGNLYFPKYITRFDVKVTNSFDDSIGLIRFYSILILICNSIYIYNQTKLITINFEKNTKAIPDHIFNASKL